MTLSEYTERFGQSALARKLGVTQGMVWQWVSGRRQIPVERCIEIERETDGAVTVEDLRADVDWSVIRGKPSRELRDALKG